MENIEAQDKSFVSGSTATRTLNLFFSRDRLAGSKTYGYIYICNIHMYYKYVYVVYIRIDIVEIFELFLTKRLYRGSRRCS